MGIGSRKLDSGYSGVAGKPILAFLQNQYFKDPERARQIFARNPDRRNDLIARYLFAGCLTGRRIRIVFDDEILKQITWEEISKEIGSRSNSRFPPDYKHIADAILLHKPQIVITFGKLAQAGFEAAWWKYLDLNREPMEIVVCPGPHPADRRNPMPALKELVKTVKFELYRLTN